MDMNYKIHTPDLSISTIIALVFGKYVDTINGLGKNKCIDYNI